MARTLLFRFSARLASLLACGVTAALYQYAQLLAEVAYDRVCDAGLMPVDPARDLIAPLLIIALPILLARGNLAIAVNLFFSLMTVFFGVLLLDSARTTPTECYTQGGSYEDHASGIPGFGLGMMLTIALLYLILLIDLIAWGIALLLRVWNRSGWARRRLAGTEVKEP